MKPDKVVKKEFKNKASLDPDTFYATKVLLDAGFHRGKCEKCDTFFWDKDKNRKICGDTMCVGGFSFHTDNPAKNKYDYVQTWQKFAELFTELGYTPIERYPVAARWRDDTDFVQASIYDFQPYVVSGEVEPPANPLVVPQFCLRFNDIDNVGVTGSHMTGFVMIGQHMFVPPDKWDQDKVFADIKTWLNKGMGIADEEITFHEDAWAGGGNFGPCMEFFSKGVEIGNQVYMLFEQTPDGDQELKLKVLDMGMGMERCTWFMQATPTMYDAVFPTVMEKLRDKVNLPLDKELMAKYVPHAGLLNADEIEDSVEAWKEVAEKMGTSAEKLQETLKPNIALYSIAEHTRTLLVALNDGALPGNVGGGYNLRVLARRILNFIDQFNWDIDVTQVAQWHAEYLKPIFPELSMNLESVKRILNVEKQKYEANKEKAKGIVDKLLASNTEITEQKLLELYDSNGIAPESIALEAKKQGKKVVVPDNFYTKVTELHEKQEQQHQTKKEAKLPLENIPDTKALYFDDFSKKTEQGKVLKIMQNNVILDQTIFYPTSGGQIHDLGSLGDIDVIDVYKQGAVIVHVLKDHPKFKEGDSVTQEIDFTRRKQLAQHHTATHIINAAAKKVLGSHINQAGARKTTGKAHLDVTHFQAITEQEKASIEKTANEIVAQHKPVSSQFYPRSDAEKKFGLMIYQGGAVPGKNIRIIDIEDTDIEACGGTHMHNTKDIGEIRITKTSKISDNIVRIEFVAGNALENTTQKQSDILGEAAKLLNVNPNQVPLRAKELFDLWKKAKKAVKKKKFIPIEELTPKSTETIEGDLLAQTATYLRTQPEFIVNTLSRFAKELNESIEKIKKF